jgi:hypothetical protein
MPSKRDGRRCFECCHHSLIEYSQSYRRETPFAVDIDNIDNSSLSLRKIFLQERQHIYTCHILRLATHLYISSFVRFQFIEDIVND